MKPLETLFVHSFRKKIIIPGLWSRNEICWFCPHCDRFKRAKFPEPTYIVMQKGIRRNGNLIWHVKREGAIYKRAHTTTVYTAESPGPFIWD